MFFCSIFFCSIFFCLTQNWVLEFMADSVDKGFVQQRGKGTMSSHLEMFDILKMLLLLQSTGVGFVALFLVIGVVKDWLLLKVVFVF